MKNLIDKILSRGVSEIIGADELRKKLETTPEKVVIKYGVDPTKPDLHLGHAVCLRKLREFQDLGCKVVFLIGDFTAQIGDPSGKSKVRPETTQAEVFANVQTYLKQVGKILKTDEQHFDWLPNADWFISINDLVPPPEERKLNFNFKGQEVREDQPRPPTDMLAKAVYWAKTRVQAQKKFKMIKSVSFRNLIATLRHITFSQLIERDMFQKRMKDGEPLFMHELLYPVIQGIDSYIIHDLYGSCDLEVGGTDQHFNMLMGRDIMKINNQKPLQAVLTLPILEGTDGKEKMSKSLDNYIGITESPTDIFGKTMRIPDELIPRWVELCTDLDEKDFAKRLKKENPKDLKVELAQELVRIYHGDEAAQKAPDEFARLFSGGSKSGRPDEIPTIQIEEGSWGIVELLANAKLVDSKSEARRLIQQGGIRVNDKKVEEVDQSFEVGKEELILQVGKRKWAKVVS